MTISSSHRSNKKKQKAKKMSQSTWYNTLNSLHAAVHDSYAAKSARQRNKREVQDVMRDTDAFCQRCDLLEIQYLCRCNNNRRQVLPTDC